MNKSGDSKTLKRIEARMHKVVLMFYADIIVLCIS
jgi:hypothetical protein